MEKHCQPINCSSINKSRMERSLEERVREVIESEIKPILAMEGGDIELLDVKDGVVRVRLRGTCAGCPFSQITLTNFVETTIKAKVNEVKSVVAEGAAFPFL